MIAKKKYNQTIVADKKPYFMNYIYPQQMAKYQKYNKYNYKHSYIKVNFRFIFIFSYVNIP